MQTIIIDEEFRSLLPAVDIETYRQLEENILENGCRDALILWNDVLIDGYNRYRICTEHDIPFNTISKEFASREEVLIWIISNQISRRNLTPIQLSYLRGLHYRADKKTQGASKSNVTNDKKPQNEVLSRSTATRLADRYKVSRATIERDAKLSNALSAIGEISPEAQRKILTGEVAVNKNKMEKLLSGSKEEIEALVVEIEEGTYKRRSPAVSVPIAQEQPHSPSTTYAAMESGNGFSLADNDFIASPVNSGDTDNQYVSRIIDSMRSNFDIAVGKMRAGGIPATKQVLRTYIDTLEELHKSL